MNMPRKNTLAVAVACASVLSQLPTVYAADNTLVLEEVIVTAQKRTQNLQKTPVAIAAFDKKDLEQKGITDIEGVSQYIPNVSIAESPSGSTGATIGIRGSVTVNPAVTWEPTVGIYMDGVFISKNLGGIFDVAELERIEVLRGPQGTLYGKNTVGGAVNLITSKPSGELSGTARIGMGNYGYSDFYASVDSPEFNKTSVNLAFNKRERDGFYDNEQTTNPNAASEFKKLDSEAGRFSAQFNLIEKLEILYSFDWSEKDNTPALGQLVVTGAPDAFKRKEEAALDGAEYEKTETKGHAIHISYEINDDLTFKSITSKRSMDFDEANDYDGVDFIGFHTQRHIEHDQTSQEFQLVGKIGITDFVVGAFMFSEESDAENPFTFYVPPNPPAIPVPGLWLTNQNFYGVDSDTQALYGQADIHLNDKLTLSAGARWNQEEKDAYINHPQGFGYSKADESWDNSTWLLSVTYELADNITTYAKASTGWKSGGFNGESQTAAIFKTPYDEETVTAYELGLKSRTLDNRLQANVAVFQNNIEDLQLSQFYPASFYSQVTNAGEATITGFELELLALLVEGLQVNLNYGYLDPEYDEFIDTEFDQLGNIVSVRDVKDEAKFPYSPKEKISLGVEYKQSLSFATFGLRFDWSYIDEHFVYHDRGDAYDTKIEQYDIINARISLADIKAGQNSSLEFAVWGKNITDEEYRINGIPFGGSALVYFGDPATYGLDAIYRFY